VDPGNIRPLAEGIERDLSGLNYGSYLHLDSLLSAQTPLSDQLATLTPTEYTQFRGVLGKASGFRTEIGR